MTIEHISAVTLAVRDMARAVAFYQKLGFELVYGGRHAAFSSLKAGDDFINLAVKRSYEGEWWGRIIFRTEDAEAQYRALQAAKLKPENPRDAPWGERFFHITDPDGHELSFAELLSSDNRSGRPPGAG